MTKPKLYGPTAMRDGLRIVLSFMSVADLFELKATMLAIPAKDRTLGEKQALESIICHLRYYRGIAN